MWHILCQTQSKSKNFSPVDLYEECAKTGRRKAKTHNGVKKQKTRTTKQFAFDQSPISTEPTYGAVENFHVCGGGMCKERWNRDGILACGFVAFALRARLKEIVTQSVNLVTHDLRVILPCGRGVRFVVARPMPTPLARVRTVPLSVGYSSPTKVS